MSRSHNTAQGRGDYSKVEHGDASKDHESAELTKSKDGKSSAKSWRAPIVMLSALAIGLGIALAHHFMCLSLNDKRVMDVQLSQSWIFRFSTALAFLVKVAFATSVGTAYVQHQWLRLRRTEFRMDDIDSLTSVLSNPLGLLSSTVWFKHPILSLVALISW